MGETVCIGDGGGLVAIGEELIGDSVMKTRCAFARRTKQLLAMHLRGVNEIRTGKNLFYSVAKRCSS